MDVSTFFTRLLQTPKEPVRTKQQDDFGDFDAAWQGIKETLEHPDERQLVKGISSTDVPAQLRHIVDALVYEGNRTDEDTTGACLEYFLKHDLLSQLERLCEADRPHGIKAEVVRAINNLVVLLSERFLVHNAVHRPLRRLLRSCVGDEPEDKLDGGARVVGAAAAGRSKMMQRRASNEDIDADLVDLMCILSSRMRAYPPLLLIFFHDKGWLQAHPPSNTLSLDPALTRMMSPTPSSYTTISEPSTRQSGKAPSQFEFLLFSYLLRFVHREGRIGDFARAGLLFLFDIAFLTPTEEGGDNLQMIEKDGSDPLQDVRDNLAEYILDGDFADVMAAGLGAVYSILPTKLRVPTLSELAESEHEPKASTSGGMHLGGGESGLEVDGLVLPTSTSPEVREQLDLLIKLFGFVQDIITRCKSPLNSSNPNDSTVSASHVLGGAISDTALDAIHSSFLDNVLYPSILECSSHDGTAVAVLTYLDAILSKLDDGPLLTRILDFLLDTESQELPVAFSSSQRKTKRKTGAMDYVGGPAHTADYFAEEGRFTIKDLIIDNLRSNESAASSAALRLLNTLLTDHCGQATRGLLSTVRDPSATALAHQSIPTSFDAIEDEPFLPRPVTFKDAHLQETELYGALITRIDLNQTSADASPGYASYLADTYTAIERDRCFRTSQTPVQFTVGDEKSGWIRVGKIPDSEGFQHRVNPSDPLLRSVMRSFSRFLSNTPDVNVAMTGFITALATCPHRSLSAWLLDDSQPVPVDPWATRTLHTKDGVLSSDEASDSDFQLELDDDPSAQVSDPFISRPPASLPALYQILRETTKQIAQIRSEIDEFDRLLSERRQGLLFADHLDEAMNVMLTLDVDTSTSTSIFGSPSTPLQKGSAAKRPNLRSGASGLASSIKSFLTPKRGTPALTQNSNSNNNSPFTPAAAHNGEPLTPVRKSERATASPFKAHYDQTTLSLEIDAPNAAITAGPWSPAPVLDRRGSTPSIQPSRAPSAQSHHLSLAEELSFSTPQSGRNDRTHPDTAKDERDEGRALQVPLSRILDNCVVLEEFVKEIVAVINARRALGIDQVGYV